MKPISHPMTFNPLFILSVSLASLFTILPSQSVAEEGWGATPLQQKHRPQRAWIDNFPSKPTVIATGSIANAIDSCDRVVGTGQYCVVQITNASTGLPIEIFRSKTKLIGATHLQPLTTSSDAAFIYIGEKTREVIIENLNLQGHKAGGNEISAIFIEGQQISHILIRNNKIQGFDSDSDAHGIAVYGTGKNEQQAIQHVMIEGNTLSNLRTGSSESIVINGNVAHWEINNNLIENINNIAIDVIGGEGTSPTRKEKGRVLPGLFDAAHHGFIEGNVINNMSTQGNPAYDNDETWAGAIYIDGAHHINIANNRVENTPWAYMIGAENCITTQHITMTNNRATGSVYGDLYIGGYAKKGYQQDKTINCNPKTSSDEQEGHGYVKFITVKKNILKSNDVSEAIVMTEYRATHIMIDERTIKAANARGKGSAKEDQNAIRKTEQ